MSNAVCPWWLGFFLLNPLRNRLHNPETILGQCLKNGMKVLDVGCGVGYFTLPMARMVGERGRVYGIDPQEKMISWLNRRVMKAGLFQVVSPRVCSMSSLAIEDLTGKIDFALAFAMVHEVPDKERLLLEIHRAVKSGGQLIIAEPRGHVSRKAFEQTVMIALKQGFIVKERPKIRRCMAVSLQK